MTMYTLHLYSDLIARSVSHSVLILLGRSALNIMTYPTIRSVLMYVHSHRTRGIYLFWLDLLNYLKTPRILGYLVTLITNINLIPIGDHQANGDGPHSMPHSTFTHLPRRLIGNTLTHQLHPQLPIHNALVAVNINMRLNR